jgi:tRNA G18 (ribose-2'-O)-methylase SpoU
MDTHRTKDPVGFVSADNQRTDPPIIYGLIENPQKNNNLGPFLRCACAFGVDLVVAIGYDKCSVEGSCKI